MAFQITKATPDDVPQLVDIYFAAFRDDLDLLIFPDTKSNRKWWSKSLRSDVSDPDVLVLKAVERVGDVETIVAWTLWELWDEEDLGAWSESDSESDSGCSSSSDSDSETESEEEFGEDETAAHGFYEMAWETHSRFMKNPHWFLEIIATSPTHQRRGAGSLLLKHGLKKVDEMGLEAYTEASPLAVPLYEKAGFRGDDRLEFKHKKSLYYHVAMVRSAKNCKEALPAVEELALDEKEG
ncbi:acyl- N-acyltransferase [Fusarium albosuccineum]|uniref:Acyl- N-acyltransferase n=1 Tax=Fusarium albosuccineum TaxID=1237068 RepID=A0A8H4PFL2_9HYPO|nr:acyl- N-acyltransferase [Fusarium albosuccineum]